MAKINVVFTEGGFANDVRLEASELLGQIRESIGDSTDGVEWPKGRIATHGPVMRGALHDGVITKAVHAVWVHVIDSFLQKERTKMNATTMYTGTKHTQIGDIVSHEIIKIRHFAGIANFKARVNATIEDDCNKRLEGLKPEKALEILQSMRSTHIRENLVGSVIGRAFDEMIDEIDALR
jgi:hypothetical protein